MDDNSTPEVVTEGEAIAKVKAWIAQMDWEKAQEGCNEILEIDPDNVEIKALLAQAVKGIAERPAQTVAPAEMVAGASPASSLERVITSEAETPEVAPPTENVAATPPPQPPAQPPAPAPVAQPAPTPAAVPAPIPARKSKTTVIIAGIVFFLVVVLLILALVFGWPIRLIG